MKAGSSPPLPPESPRERRVRRLRVARRAVVRAAPLTVVAVGIAAAIGWGSELSKTTWDWLVVSSLGGAVGFSELVARYRDSPERAVSTYPAVLYIGINAGASAAAFGIIRTFDLSFGIDSDPSGDKLRWARIITAGTTGMAVLRSSLFTIRAGDRDVAVGPGGFLQIVLDATDAAIDRNRARHRAREARGIMRDVTFARAAPILPRVCLALMQNLPDRDQKRLADEVLRLKAASDLGESARAMNLGVAIIDAVGADVLAEAVAQLRPHLMDRSADVAAAMQGLALDKAAAALPLVCFALSPSISDEEQEILVNEAQALRATTGVDERARLLSLGLGLADMFGPEVVIAAVAQLGDAIREQPATGPPRAAPAADPPPAEG